MRLRESFRQTMIQPVKFSGMQDREPIAFGGWHAAARQHDPVILVARDDESARRIHNGGLLRIVKLRQELGKASPAAVPGRPDGMTYSVLDIQLASGFPAVLRKPVH